MKKSTKFKVWKVVLAKARHRSVLAWSTVFHIILSTTHQPLNGKTYHKSFYIIFGKLAVSLVKTSFSVIQNEFDSSAHASN